MNSIQTETLPVNIRVDASPVRVTMAQFALRWILMFDAVTCAIPGAKRPSQAEDNARAADFSPID